MEGVLEDVVINPNPRSNYEAIPKQRERCLCQESQEISDKKNRDHENVFRGVFAHTHTIDIFTEELKRYIIE